MTFTASPAAKSKFYFLNNIAPEIVLHAILFGCNIIQKVTVFVEIFNVCVQIPFNCLVVHENLRRDDVK